MWRKSFPGGRTAGEGPPVEPDPELSDSKAHTPDTFLSIFN